MAATLDLTALRRLSRRGLDQANSPAGIAASFGLTSPGSPRGRVGGMDTSLSSGAGAVGQNPGLASDPRRAFTDSLLSASQSKSPNFASALAALAQLRSAAPSSPSSSSSSVPSTFRSPTDPAVTYEIHGPVDAHTKAAIQLAESFVGTPYVWGGSKPGGFDCSGLLYYAYGRQGIQIPRTSQAQWKAGRPVPLNQLKPGDAVFFHMGASGPGHVAIFIGGGKMLESPHTGARVRIVPLRGDVVGARRFR